VDVGPLFRRAAPVEANTGTTVRADQFFPAAFVARQIRERLGVDPVEIPGGHYAMLSEP
jgi:hypothetical protein